jgi:hypothetical protein
MLPKTMSVRFWLDYSKPNSNEFLVVPKTGRFDSLSVFADVAAFVLLAVCCSFFSDSVFASLFVSQPTEARERGVVLIVDRSMDPLAPLMHELTYQTFVNDIFPVDGDLC